VLTLRLTDQPCVEDEVAITVDEELRMSQVKPVPGLSVPVEEKELLPPCGTVGFVRKKPLVRPWTHSRLSRIRSTDSRQRLDRVLLW
jgi:hypothetical protein